MLRIFAVGDRVHISEHVEGPGADEEGAVVRVDSGVIVHLDSDPEHIDRAFSPFMVKRVMENA